MNSQKVQEEVKNELNDLMANFSLGAKPSAVPNNTETNTSTKGEEKEP